MILHSLNKGPEELTQAYLLVQVTTEIVLMPVKIKVKDQKITKGEKCINLLIVSTESNWFKGAGLD